MRGLMAFAARMLVIAVIFTASAAALLHLAAEELPGQGISYWQSRPAAVTDGLFGNIRISSMDGTSLEQAYLLVNGEVAADFGSGEVLLRIHEGDVLSIDGSAYLRQLEFYVTALSAGVDRDLLTMQVTTQGDLVALGKIHFK
ncbi:MAG: hypothetical protein IJF62_02990 [Firmicutes bacterium]|nr:hypothetical protein [Bacillota bacterium]